MPSAVRLSGLWLILTALPFFELHAEFFVWAAPSGGPASYRSNWRTNGVVPDRLPGTTDSILLDGTGLGPVVWNGGQDTGDGVLADTVGNWFQTPEFSGEVLFSNMTFSTFATTFTNLTVTGSCVISNGWWTHQEHPKSVVWTNRYLLKISVGGNFELAPGAGSTPTAKVGGAIIGPTITMSFSLELWAELARGT